MGVDTPRKTCPGLLVLLIAILALTTTCVPPQAKYTLSGTVSGSWKCINAGSSAMPTTIGLMPLEWEASFTHASPQFSFTGVPEGDYTLVVSCIAEIGRADYPGVPVAVSQTDVHVDVVLPFPTLPQRSPARTLAAHAGLIRGIAFSPDGSTIVSAHQDGTIVRWDLIADEPLRFPLHEYAGADLHPVLTPDTALLAAVAHDTTVKLWETRSGKLLQTLGDFDSPVQGLAISPDGTRLATWEENDSNRIVLWDVTTGSLLRSLNPDQDHQNTWRARQLVAFVKNGAMLVSAARGDSGPGGDWTITWWEVATGEPIRAFTLPDNMKYGLSGMNSLAISGDETHFAFGMSGVENYGGLVIWNVPENLLAVSNYPVGLAQVAFSPHRTLVGSTAFDNTVVLWDPVTGTAHQVLASDHRGIHQFTWSPDGKTLAAGDDQGRLLLWEIPAKHP